ncbi:GtrA family protein [Streptomyces oryzae]|nr:GtrA family protein [Streptomyces oryzae]
MPFREAGHGAVCTNDRITAAPPGRAGPLRRLSAPGGARLRCEVTFAGDATGGTGGTGGTPWVTDGIPQALRAAAAGCRPYPAAVPYRATPAHDPGSAVPEGLRLPGRLVRCAPRGVADLPCASRRRYADRSKPAVRERLRFLRRPAALRRARPAVRMVAFALIGLSGLAPNLVVLHLLVGAGTPYLPAEAVANQFGVAWNFLLIEALLFPHRRSHRHWADRAGRFALLANADLLLRIPLSALLVQQLGLAVLPATALALAVTCALRFAATEVLVYLPRSRRPPAPGRQPLSARPSQPARLSPLCKSSLLRKRPSPLTKGENR